MLKKSARLSALFTNDQGIMKFEVFDAPNAGWKAAVEKIGGQQADIQFLPEWYLTWEEYEQAESRCIVASEDGFSFLYPFLMKPIAYPGSNETYYDIQSAYGYGGVICSYPHPPKQLIGKFNFLVNEWLESQHVVAEFIREHPLLDHCRRDATYVMVRKNVFVKPEENYKIPEIKTRQAVARILRNPDIEVITDEKLSHLDEFVHLYNLNAKRIGMSKYYFFPDRYFELLKTHLKDHCFLIHVVFKQKIINSLLCFTYADKVTPHLAGADYDYNQFRGSDLLYYSLVKQSQKPGIEMINLGGGMSVSDDDSLFRYKKKFSNVFRNVFIGKKIINQPVYDDLIKSWAIQYPHLVEANKNFFLRYRITE